MPVLSDTCLLCTLPSGNKAVYAVQPQHLNEFAGTTLNERAIMYGEQIAHELDGKWYYPNGWNPVEDMRIVVLLERCPTS